MHHKRNIYKRFHRGACRETEKRVVVRVAVFATVNSNRVGSRHELMSSFERDVNQPCNSFYSAMESLFNRIILTRDSINNEFPMFEGYMYCMDGCVWKLTPTKSIKTFINSHVQGRRHPKLTAMIVLKATNLLTTQG